MVASLGGVYFYKSIVTKNISEMEKNLNIAKNRFEPAKITELKILDKRLKASNAILSNHITVSPIFNALSEITMKSIRYTKFSYDMGDSQESRIIVKLSGKGLRYSSIALQADLFTKNKNLIDPVFSDLSLDEKGNVLFKLEFAVEPSFVDYRQTVENELSSSVNVNPQEVQKPVVEDVIKVTPEVNPKVNPEDVNPFWNQ